MTPIFADTYYWLALINPRDAGHPEALSISGSLTQPVVTTAWVLTEVGDAMRVPANRATFIQLLRAIASDSETSVVPPTQEWFDRGTTFYATRLDKKWSLTDCISMLVMREMGLTEVLTADADFAQAGFRILMTRTP